MAPMLRLYNTLTREKARFSPIDPTHVRMYACGPTVYDAAHIGNARPIIVFDLLFRLLRHLYGPAHVVYARNVTDVDDKINARALARGITIRELTDGTLEQFHADIRDLGVLMPDDVNVAGEPARMIEPRATDHIGEMVQLIEGLVAAGHAYVAADHVLFDVPSMPDYGALSKRPLDEMEAGARVEVAPYKRSPLDFVLWKPSKPGEPSWPSPSGIAAPGRPGWHIECSAMSWKHLGKTFDIHAGGIDLIFPHHENEVAQSRCCFGTDVMANVWLHNGFLQVEGEKMSKSAGNFITIREVLNDWPGEVVRLNMLKTHYRQPIDWTLRNLEESQKTWVSLGNIVRDHLNLSKIDDVFLAALSDDLNTAAAFARIFEMRDLASRGEQAIGQSLTASLRMLGFFENAFALKRQISYSLDAEELVPDELIKSVRRLSEDYDLRDVASHFRRAQPDEASSSIAFFLNFTDGTTVRELKQLKGKPSQIIAIDAERRAARAQKQWAESDRLRDELAALGIAVKDNKDGTTSWSVK